MFYTGLYFNSNFISRKGKCVLFSRPIWKIIITDLLLIFSNTILHYINYTTVITVKITSYCMFILNHLFTICISFEAISSISTNIVFRRAITAIITFFNWCFYIPTCLFIVYVFFLTVFTCCALLSLFYINDNIIRV